jgi:hypothetical protein
MSSMLVTPPPPLFVSAHERGRELLGPAPHDSSLQSRQNQGFSRGDFTID